MKKLLAMILAVVMVVSLLPAAVFAGGESAFTATIPETDRTYNVYFYHEDGTTKLGETLGVIKGEEAKTDIVPEKASDVQYDYTFDGWVTLDGGEFDITNITEDVSVKASFTATLRKYTVTYLDEDKETVLGTEEVEYGSAATGEGIEAVKEADKWYTYEFGKWVSDDEGVDLELITGDVSVYADYYATFVPHYIDLEPTRFYGKAVEWALTNGIMNGTSDTTFSPGGTTTRGQVVTVLYRMEGAPAPDSENIKNFDDVPAGKYYSDAVMWAASYGVVKGMSATTFEPDTPVTREQFVTILYRYAGEVKGYYVGFGKASLSGFEDKNDISGWAASAVKWAIATEDDMYTQGYGGYWKEPILTGVTEIDGKFYMKPKAFATRGQLVTILERFVNRKHLTQAEADEQL